MPYKIGIVGAARRQQGTGPYIARTFANLGHEICAIVGTSENSSTEAVAYLSSQYGINALGYTSASKMIEQHSLDILVIASPPATHLSYLELGAEKKLHIFCEKPFWWPENEKLDLPNYQKKLEKVIELSKANQRLIHLNTQWPYTLKDFVRLHPYAIIHNEIKQFAMHLSPQSKGVKMLVDAASHGLSMLYQLVGAGNLNDIKVEHSPNSVSINFDYDHQRGRTKTKLKFNQSNETPKPASYQINGHEVKRTVSLPEYQIQLQSDQQTISITDPLDASIRDFLASIDAELLSDEDALMLGARHLYQLIENY
ncbi:MAG: Gfo/Idh/MocA family oxidoreductase [Gammaproteobacteria bacterium]|nr:Gfo/Idh/MocA family oxidoreductase [Gammaproteobacteria bacterium]